MPRIRLTYWWRDHQPGDVVEVVEEDLPAVLGVLGTLVEEPKARGKRTDG